MIEGVRIVPLKQIADARGKIMHMVRSDSDQFTGFGEIYFSTVFPGVVKGWHIHRRMVLNYAVPHGLIKLVLYDDRPKSPSRGKVQEIVIGQPDHYHLVTIPPMVWNGFQGLAREMSIVANCASIPHDPLEIERVDPFNKEIPYQWEETKK